MELLLHFTKRTNIGRIFLQMPKYVFRIVQILRQSGRGKTLSKYQYPDYQTLVSCNTKILKYPKKQVNYTKNSDDFSGSKYGEE